MKVYLVYSYSYFRQVSWDLPIADEWLLTIVKGSNYVLFDKP